MRSMNLMKTRHEYTIVANVLKYLKSPKQFYLMHYNSNITIVIIYNTLFTKLNKNYR